MQSHPAPPSASAARVLIAGATGLVGRWALQFALADVRVRQVVAPTRKPLPANPRLLNPVIDFDRLPEDAEWWEVDAVACALGTTLRDAGSREAFVRVDHAYPLRIARLAQRAGAGAYALVSATGADPGSRVFYSRTKGQLERDLQSLRLRSLTLVRPSLLGGQRMQRRTLEGLGQAVVGALAPVVPRRYRVVPAEAVARTLLEAALSPRPGVHVIENEAIAAA
jgi:uncharacterized protein YbjT (DUF2867 family)